MLNCDFPMLILFFLRFIKIKYEEEIMYFVIIMFSNIKHNKSNKLSTVNFSRKWKWPFCKKIYFENVDVIIISYYNYLMNGSNKHSMFWRRGIKLWNSLKLCVITHIDYNTYKLFVKLITKLYNNLKTT